VTDQHLILIRGNSASGKTTLARELQLAMGRGTANIGQDHFRRVVLREHDIPHGDNIDLIATTARHCLDAGYHVILEGIFLSGHYSTMLRHLFSAHQGPSHTFYLDVPLDETLRRHQRRPLSVHVTDEKLREWYVASDLLGTPGEFVLDHTRETTAIVRDALNIIGPITPRPEQTGGRYL